MISGDHRIVWILSGIERMMGWAMLCLGSTLRVDEVDHLVDAVTTGADLVLEGTTVVDLAVEVGTIEDEGAQGTAQASRA